MMATMLPNLNFSTKWLLRQGLLWLLLILLCAILQWSGAVSELRYDRQLIASGQWYRVISANFVHLNNSHLLMNVLGVVMVMVFFSNHLKKRQWIGLIVVSSLFVSIGLMLFNPEIHRYVGLSGVLHGLFIAGAMAEIKRFPLSGWLLLAVLLAKLAWEQLVGAMPGSESMIKGHVVVDSHFYGAIAGFVFYGLIWLKKSK